MGQVVNVAENILRVVAKLLQTELEHFKGHLLVLAAVVLHESGSHKNVMATSLVLTSLLEDLPGGLDALGPSGELHVLDVALVEEQAGCIVFAFAFVYLYSPSTASDWKPVAIGDRDSDS